MSITLQYLYILQCVYVYNYILLHSVKKIHMHTYIRMYIHTYVPTYLPTYIHTYIHRYITLHYIT